MTKKHKCDSMKTVGRKPTQKRTSNSKNGYQGRRNRSRKVERKIKINMGNFERMTIPIEADGIVDDQDAFEEQQAKNEAQLANEIAESREGDGLVLGDYEDIQGEFVVMPKQHEYSAKALDKVQSRKIGRAALLSIR